MYDTQFDDELDKASKDRVFLEYKTNLAKNTFIGEMKNGLGHVIKENPNRVTFIKKPWHIRFGRWFKKLITKLFTKF